jgi:uncharacterized SAM-binding protein YcdF (DUF218 family)
VLLGFAAAVGLGVWAVAQVGAWLVVADPLERAPAVVVLSGRMPFRAMEAASLYRAGWAAGVWVTAPTGSPDEAALARLGLSVAPEAEHSRRVLERLGVPPAAVRALEAPMRNTADELRVVEAELRRGGGDRVILVTSAAHSRRVRSTWRAVIGGSPRAIVRFATEEPYDGRRWWRSTGDALAVSREVFGLLNVWAGFPVQPESR